MSDRDDRQFWSVGQLARRWSVSRSVVYKWIVNEVLPATRIGPKLYRVPDAAVQRFESGNPSTVSIPSTAADTRFPHPSTRSSL